MAHLFTGPPDQRQSADSLPASRFRPRYRALSEAEIGLHDSIKTKASELEALVEQVSPGRYQALALTALEESIMWAIKGLTA